jgi:hypothetical protein
MREDAASKVQRYRQAANKYGELAKHAEPDYLAAVFRKVAVRYVFMAEELVRLDPGLWLFEHPASNHTRRAMMSALSNARAVTTQSRRS